MNNGHASMMEVYLKKIVEQNESIINLLKAIAVNIKPETKTQDEEKQIIISKVEALTKRERQILELIMQGMMNKQMAYDLSLSLSTIEAHRSQIMKKLEARNVAQLTILYMKFQSFRKSC